MSANVGLCHSLLVGLQKRERRIGKLVEVMRINNKNVDSENFLPMFSDSRRVEKAQSELLKGARECGETTLDAWCNIEFYFHSPK